eukprot:scaffold673799_cov36-Prasinocladus_malaysianus.AAC.1
MPSISRPTAPPVAPGRVAGGVRSRKPRRRQNGAPNDRPASRGRSAAVVVARLQKRRRERTSAAAERRRPA